MSTNSSISVTEGSGKNIATHSISESTTKEIQRIELNDSTGAELAVTANPLKVAGTGTAGTAATGVMTIQGIASMTALKVDGSAVTQPVSGTVTITPSGTQTVSGTVAATQSGTWTVQPGNTPNTSPWLTTNIPATSGGLTTSHIVSAASTNATVVKASAGQLFGWYIYNSNAAARKVAFHNASTTPTAGASVFFSLVIPPSAGANVELTNGIAFSTGIAVTMVTGLADSDSTGVALNDLIVNLWYK